MAIRAPARIGCLLLAVAVASCEGDEPRPDADADDADVDPADVGADAEEALADGDTTVDGDLEAAPGSLTLVIDVFELVADRLCDLDGDAVLDSAIGDLGEPSAGFFAIGLTSLVQGTIEGGDRLVLHFPLIDDRVGLNDPDSLLILFHATDGEQPHDLSDDFTGDETYYVKASSLDPCGEPTSVFFGASIDRGSMAADSGSFPLEIGPTVFVARDARAGGEITAGGASAAVWICGYVLASELGAVPGFDGAGVLNALEVFLTGGSAFGLPTLPGLSPDVDVDGDGLERMVTDADGRIVACVDGDLTSIEGRDCWQDQRIADGFSLNARATAVGAVFGGLEADWDRYVVGTCEDHPEESLWDPR